ncbi:hypothetical protein BB559_002085 [Furculomyces boomerangus]|uniref:CTLH domain-containing protein n=1 Tax=Furculomyces boomerangus TaxID=61424 RepID=A0A2T9YYC6_9FUNG|nr:hypothetical protein BB559_002085 [Furculomyces boomerangus]
MQKPKKFFENGVIVVIFQTVAFSLLWFLYCFSIASGLLFLYQLFLFVPTKYLKPSPLLKSHNSKTQQLFFILYTLSLYNTPRIRFLFFVLLIQTDTYHLQKTMEKINTENSYSIEHPFLKIVVEKLKKAVRQSQKQIEKEMSQIQVAVDNLPENNVDTSEDVQMDDVPEDNLIFKLKELKTKLKDKKTEERNLILQLNHRANHLKLLESFQSTNDPEYSTWSSKRVDRFLMDYMMKTGYQTSASNLATHSDLESFTDSQLFSQLINIQNSLLVQNSCKECLQWCSENKAALKRLKIGLEFELRLQEVTELARQRKSSEAIAYSKKHFKQLTDIQKQRLNQTLALLVIMPTTDCRRYKSLYSSERWPILADQFKTAAYQLYGFPSQPILSVLLQTGISALKTYSCTRSDPEDFNKNCPICSSNTLHNMSKNLPFSYHTNSSLVCRISGQKMNENNPPMRLPNGYVYSYSVSIVHIS